MISVYDNGQILKKWGNWGRSTCQPNKYLTLMNTIKSPRCGKRTPLACVLDVCHCVNMLAPGAERGKHRESRRTTKCGSSFFLGNTTTPFFLMYCNVGMHFIVVTLYHSIYRQLKLLATPLYSSPFIFKNKKIHFSFRLYFYFTGKKYFRHQMILKKINK